MDKLEDLLVREVSVSWSWIHLKHNTQLIITRLRCNLRCRTCKTVKSRI
jgi:hypothetical protein